MNTISDIIFDLGNVLVPFDWNKAIDRLIPRLSMPLVNMILQDQQSFRKIFLKHSLQIETGRMDFESFWKLTCGQLGVDISLEEFRVLWCDIFEMDESMVSLGKSLAGNYRVWLASNTCEEHFQWIIKRFPRIRFFRGAALSYELGIMKPARGYYDRAIELFGISPTSSLFIDDIRENVQTARTIGMHGIVFTGYAQLTEDLEKCGIKTNT